MDELCRACFDGVYPIELPLAERLGKHVLEDAASDGATPVEVDDRQPVAAGVGAADALTRP